MEGTVPQIFEVSPPNLCYIQNGRNHPHVYAGDEREEWLKWGKWADPSTGHKFKWWRAVIEQRKMFSQKWLTWPKWGVMKICTNGWSDMPGGGGGPEGGCPWSFEEYWQDAVCFKPCQQVSNSLFPNRNPADGVEETLNAWDQAILWSMFVCMTYMVATWTVFREKAKQRMVLVLCVLMWLQTFIELLGYIIYPSSQDRFCENEVVPRHHGFNYCAVSAMLVQGIISPMFQMMIACMALDVYFKVCLNVKNVNHYWKYYTVVSFLTAFCGKFIPVFLMLEVGGFDGVNACGYTFWIWHPTGSGAPNPVDFVNPKLNLDLSTILLMNAVDHLAFVIAVSLFSRIIYAVLQSMKRVGSSSDESSMATALKQIRLVKTPVLMIIFFTIYSAVQIYMVDVFALTNWKYFGPSDNTMPKAGHGVPQQSSVVAQFMWKRDTGEYNDSGYFSEWQNINSTIKVRQQRCWPPNLIKA